MRAIESGEYVVRAAATGVSGIIAPDGAWQTRLPLDVPGEAAGFVGPPTRSFFAHMGPTRLWFFLIALYLIVVLFAGRADAERVHTERVQ
jgi:apolipoprotein N-acyltransferase